MLSMLKTVGEAVGCVLFFFGMFVGVVLIPLGVPGQFVIVAATLLFTLVFGSAVLSWWVFWVVLGLALLAELLEAGAGLAGAKRASGSLRASVGALIGGIAGAVLGSFVLPVIGSLIGAFVGTFAGAFVFEIHRTRQLEGAAHVARAAVVARLLGSMAKTMIAVCMIALITVALVYGL